MVDTGYSDDTMVDIGYSDDTRFDIRVFPKNCGWVRFLVVCFLYKTNPSPRKIICCGKKWPNCHFSPKKIGLGVALGWGARRFHPNATLAWNMIAVWSLI